MKSPVVRDELRSALALACSSQSFPRAKGAVALFVVVERIIDGRTTAVL